MSKLNPTKKNKVEKLDSERLAGGFGPLAAKQDSESLLRRAVNSCLLFEDLAYETGAENADNIAALIPKVAPEKVAQIAFEARKNQKLRHVPLFILSEMAKHPNHKLYVSEYLPKVATRADMITDFLSIYWKNGKKPIANQIKKGLAESFHNFDEYAFGKYDRNSNIKLRDVMFLVRPNPKDKKEKALFKKIANRELKTPDTWEVELSQSKDKKASWTRLIQEGKLGSLAFLRNLRNFKDNNVDHNIIRKGFENLSGLQMLLPMNFFAARQYAPEFESEIESLMIKTYSNLAKLPGYTIFVVDVSGSMGSGLSSGSSFDRLATASAMALLARNQCEEIDIFCTAGNDGTRIHKTSKIDYPDTGFKLIDQINKEKNVLGGGGIFTSQCLDYIKKNVSKKPDRIIIFSDSQDCSSPKVEPKPFGKNNYIVDVSAHKHGINYKGVWTAEISGWSDHFLTYIASLEGINNDFEQD